MILRKSRFSKNLRSQNRNSSRRGLHTRKDSFQRNGSYRGDNSNKTKIRGNPNQLLSKYLIMAKNALSSGDRIQAEYYFQFADHYSRTLVENGMSINFNKNEANENNEVPEDLSPKSKDDENQEESKNTEDYDQENNLDEKNLESVAFLSNSITKKK